MVTQILKNTRNVCICKREKNEPFELNPKTQSEKFVFSFNHWLINHTHTIVACSFSLYIFVLVLFSLSRYSWFCEILLKYIAWKKSDRRVSGPLTKTVVCDVCSFSQRVIHAPRFFFDIRWFFKIAVFFSYGNDLVCVGPWSYLFIW